MRISKLLNWIVMAATIFYFKSRWRAGSYAEAGALMRRMHFVPLVKSLAIRMEAECILDAGCGSGTGALALAKRLPGIKVVGLDVDPDAYQLCLVKKEYFHCNNVDFILGSLIQPFGKRLYDIIYCVDVLEHIEDDVQALINIHDSLKPGGWFVLHVPTAERDNIFHLTYKIDKIIDRTAHHVRDGYNPSVLHKRVEDAGFEVTNSYSTFAKWRGGLAWEINAILWHGRPFTFPIILCFIPICLLLSLIDVLTRESSKKGKGILLVARRRA
jgi:SAM-dependent methyltransferase